MLDAVENGNSKRNLPLIQTLAAGVRNCVNFSKNIDHGDVNHCGQLETINPIRFHRYRLPTSRRDEIRCQIR